MVNQNINMLSIIHLLTYILHIAIPFQFGNGSGATGYRDTALQGTSIFTKEIRRLLPDDDYKQLQTALMLRPDAGDLIHGTGGLRKIRWNLPHKGKRGSLRVIYYWDKGNIIYMLLPYKKE